MGQTEWRYFSGDWLRFFVTGRQSLWLLLKDAGRITVWTAVTKPSVSSVCPNNKGNRRRDCAIESRNDYGAYRRKSYLARASD